MTFYPGGMQSARGQVCQPLSGTFLKFCVLKKSVTYHPAACSLALRSLVKKRAGGEPGACAYTYSLNISENQKEKMAWMPNRWAELRSLPFGLAVNW